MTTNTTIMTNIKTNTTWNTDVNPDYRSPAQVVPHGRAPHTLVCQVRQTCVICSDRFSLVTYSDYAYLTDSKYTSGPLDWVHQTFMGRPPPFIYNNIFFFWPLCTNVGATCIGRQIWSSTCQSDYLLKWPPSWFSHCKFINTCSMYEITGIHGISFFKTNNYERRATPYHIQSCAIFLFIEGLINV